MAKYKIVPSSRTIVHSPISIGHKAEKGVEAIEFDLTAWVETYGSGTLTVIMRRWGDAIPYPIALEINENNKATWTLSDIDTAKAGMAYAQLSYIVGDEVVKKSDIYTFRVMDSLTGEGDPPEAYESWLEHLTRLAAEAMAEVLDIEGIVTDKTLTVDGGIADAKATGDALALKADKLTTYTKTEVDALIDEVEVETDTTLEIAGAAADAKKTGDEIAAVKANLENQNEEVNIVSKEIGVCAGVFKSTGISHSSANDQIPVDIKAGETFSIRAMFDTSVSGAVQVWAFYADGTFASVIGMKPNKDITLIASKDIVKIGITVGAQSTGYTCNVIINTENSTAKKTAKIDELNHVLFENLGKDVSFSMTSGTTHSSVNDRMSVNISAGETYAIIIRADESVWCEVYEIDSVSNSTKVKTVKTNTEVILTASKEVAKIGVAVGEVSADTEVTVSVCLTTAIPRQIDDMQNEIGVKRKTFTVKAKQNHSSSIETDMIYVDDIDQTSFYVTVKSASGVSKPAQAFGFDESNNGTNLGSFYTNGYKKGITVNSDIIKIGVVVSNASYNSDDTFTFIVESFGGLSAKSADNTYERKVDNARHIKGLNAKPLTLLHFSDIHGEVNTLNRITNYVDELRNSIDDSICTGDINADTAGQIEAWWNPDILTCIGNHDCATKGNGVYHWTALSMADRDAYYIAPFESNWGIAHTAGTSYYYKDYSNQHVRLIVMDAMLYNDNGADATAQTAWLADLLASAITNNLHVLIAIHAPHGGAVPVECSFSRYGQGTMPTNSDCNTPQTVIDVVAEKIASGLNFVGYIVGHTHQDNIWDAKNDKTQLMYCVTCAGTQTGLWKNSDQNRSAIEDAFNVITIDTENTLVKIVRGGGADIDDHMRTRKAICFNYSTGEKVGEVL